MGEDDGTGWSGGASPEKRSSVRLKAPAKINLTLHVLAKRSDGYHELLTRMQKLALSDDIILRKSDRPVISLKCTAAHVPADKTNLAWKAAEIFLREACEGEQLGVSIELGKNIPVAAGLGGGSSDAGTVLKGLNKLFKKNISEAELIGMAKKLGADVPFFVTEFNAVVATGIGDKLAEVDSLEGFRVVLLNPGFAVSTRWVYENYALTRTCKTFKREGLHSKADGSFDLHDMSNDLEKVTMERYPVVGELKAALLEYGAAGAMMSGSGPTVFGLFREVPGKQQYDFDMISKELSSMYGGKVIVTEIAQ